MSMTKVSTADAPEAIGPYSQAFKTDGGVLYMSGQIPLDPKSMQIVGGDDVAAQTEQVFANIKAVLGAAGLTLKHVVKTTVYITTMDNFAKCNDVYAKHFGEHKPARSCVAVYQLPKNALVEIECLALLR